MGDAMLAGVSGLQAFQQMLDVTGNNLANANTDGFKASRLSFSTMLAQTLQDASPPSATSGGTDPVQVGSGVQVGGVSPNMAQGSLDSTGQPLDMAIQGAGYFTLSNGQGDVYTRVGSFSVDADNYLVDPATGYRVQRTGNEGVAEGFQSASNSGIQIPYDVAVPAKATSTVTFTGNLSADGNDRTTNVLGTSTVFTLAGGAVASETTPLADIQGANVAPGDQIVIQGTEANGSYVGGSASGVTYTIDAGDTIDTLLSKISQAYGGSGSELNVADGDTAVVDPSDDYITSSAADASITITYDGVTKTLTKDNVTNPAVQAALTTSGDSASLADFASAINEAFNGSVGASGNTLQNIAQVGYAAGSGAGDVLQFQDNNVGAVSPMSLSATGIGYTNGVSTMDTTSVTTRGTAQHIAGSDGTNGSTASLVNGQIQLTDDTAGYSQTTMQLSYVAGAGNATGSFPSTGQFQILTAGGAETKTVNMQVYDSQGTSYTVSGTFVRTNTNNEWDLVLNSISGGATLDTTRVSGIQFLSDGSFGGMAPVTGPDGSTVTDQPSFQVSFPSDPTNIATIKMSMGTVGGFNGLSQFGGTSTAAPSAQDGCASGSLSSMSVTTGGVLVGVFSNGTQANIATIELSTFQNPAALTSVGHGYYEASTNSGDAIATVANVGGAGTIQGGSLEESNVDTATEFVNLMEAQNGFEANARTISVASNIFTDLTNLIR